MTEDFSEFEGMTQEKGLEYWQSGKTVKERNFRRRLWNRYIMHVHTRQVPPQEEAYRDANPLLYESLSKGGKKIMIPPPDPPLSPW